MNSKMLDHFELKFAILPKGVSSIPGAQLLKLSVLINDINISPENVIDLEVLIASFKGSGNFNIVTCVCGEAGCIGKSQGVKVVHDSSKVSWQIPINRAYSHELNSLQNNKTKGFVMFQFEYSQMISTIKASILEAISLLSNTNEPIAYEPFGFNRSCLEELSLLI
jgi:hypothetical protein